jgi:aryl-alcohol dehydrogenase-like predicted oxidoreductase
MQIRNLGGSGLRVSAVGLGCNNFGQRIDLEASRKVIHKAIDLGITLFDTADIYAGMGGSETVLGQVLGDRRKDIVLATKYSKPMSARTAPGGAPAPSIVTVRRPKPTPRRPLHDLHQRRFMIRDLDQETFTRAPTSSLRQKKSATSAIQISTGDRGSAATADERQSLRLRQDEYSLVVATSRILLPVAREYRLGLLPFFHGGQPCSPANARRGGAATPALLKRPRCAGLRHAATRPSSGQAFAERGRHARTAFSWLASRPQSQRHRRRHRRTGQADVRRRSWALSAETRGDRPRG